MNYTTINYELAKKLKDAGFPQELKNVVRAITKKGSFRGTFNTTEEIDDGLEWILIPTLSELIEACGEDFGSLVKIEDKNCPHKWEAWLPSFHLLRVEVCKGNTPEEAVANLYLELNKNKNE